MDCYKSFQININETRSFTSAGVNVVTWGTLGNQHFIVNSSTLLSVFNVTGFKNINIFKVKLLGSVTPTLVAAKSIVSDYGWGVTLNGQNGIIGGNFGTNNFSATTTNQRINLTKYISEIEFGDPIQSCQSIQVSDFFAMGNNAETLNSITLELKNTFIFYYKFEGE